MGASLLITLREGLEMALIVAILLAYLRKIDRLHEARQVWIGVAAAVATCVAAAVVFSIFVDSFEESSAEPWVEGILSLTAGVVLTWMIFWMRGHARGIAGELHSKIDTALNKGGGAIAMMAFVAVAREGFETVLFLLGAKESTKRAANFLVRRPKDSVLFARNTTVTFFTQATNFQNHRRASAHGSIPVPHRTASPDPEDPRPHQKSDGDRRDSPGHG